MSPPLATCLGVVSWVPSAGQGGSNRYILKVKWVKNGRDEISMVLHVSGNSEQICSKRHFDYILTLLFVGFLKNGRMPKIHWARHFCGIWGEPIFSKVIEPPCFPLCGALALSGIPAVKDDGGVIDKISCF